MSITVMWGESKRLEDFLIDTGAGRTIFGTMAAVELLREGGGCAICGVTEPKGKGDGWNVDHDHASGRVRGIVCHRCNVCLGHYEQFAEVVGDYLRRHVVA